MGNAITNPARFIEKKIEHEIFGLPDPKKISASHKEIFEKCHKQNFHIIEKHMKNQRYTKSQQAEFLVTPIIHSLAIKHCYNNALKFKK